MMTMDDETDEPPTKTEKHRVAISDKSRKKCDKSRKKCNLAVLESLRKSCES